MAGRIGALLPMAFVLVALAGCKDDAIRPPMTVTAADSADQVLEGMEHLITSDGVKRIRVIADTAYLYEVTQLARLKVVKTTFFDGNGLETSTVTSDSGLYQMRDGSMSAWGNVVATTPDGRRLKSAELKYDARTKEISSDQPFTYDRAEQHLEGNGFTSDPDFRNVVTKQPRGGERHGGAGRRGRAPRAMRSLCVALLVGTVAVTSAPAQQRPAKQPAPAAGCEFQLDHVGGLGRQVIVGVDTNYYAGGGVTLMCADSSARIASDSVALNGRRRDTIVEFIGQVKYEDSLTMQTANRGTYLPGRRRAGKPAERCTTQSKRDSSTIDGPSLDYFRTVPGVRDTVELYAIARPTIKSFTTDSAGRRGEPYVIVADRVRMKGNDRTWAGGKVTIDRSDFAARSDSLFLDNGAASEGVLVGSPLMKGLGRDSFQLTGRRIHLDLDHQAITYVKALGDGHAVSQSLDLVADTIGLDLEHEKLIQTLAWGDSIRPRGLTTDYEIRGDSVAFDTPDQQLREVRSFTNAWVGGKVDTVTKERDWMSGDSVVASFVTSDSAGQPRTTLGQLEARGKAHSYYRLANKKVATGLPSIDYTRGDRITVLMKTGSARGVDRVLVHGNVDGVHIEPAPAPPPDSTSVARPGALGAR